MDDPFIYRPKYVDIRIRKPMRPSQAKAEVRQCEHPGCTQMAVTPAPKSRDNPRDVWWFCQEHAALYNRNWNYFEGMSDDEFAAFQDAQAHGHRETWSFRAPPNARAGAATGGTSGSGPGSAAWQRASGAFRARRSRWTPGSGAGAGPHGETGAPVPGPIREALGTLELGADASGADVRRAYTELVRRYHPDANGGDRSAEGRLSAVVKAYKVLKTARRA
jgi:hypothetical protein